MNFIDRDIQEYCEAHSSDEGELLNELNLETHRKVLYPQMLAGHLQGRFLAMISKMLRPRRVLEIGTFTGYSAICFAEGLADDGLVYTIDHNAELEDMAKSYFERAGFADKIKMLVGDASGIIPQIDEVLDLVLLDADKQNYIKYYEMVLPKMRKGGIIVADNVLWSGKVLEPNEGDKETMGLFDFANHTHADDRVENVLLPVRDGIMLIIKK